MNSVSATAETAKYRKTRTPVSAKRLRKLPKASGAFTVFVPISTRRGAKFFRAEKLRDSCYRFQRRLAQYGLAPKVFQTFETKFNGILYYAFVTERADGAENGDQTANGDFPGGCTRVGNFPNEDFNVGYEQLVEALNALGVHWNDAHWGNFGFLDGRCVVIDCDPNYFRWTSKDSPLRDIVRQPA